MGETLEAVYEQDFMDCSYIENCAFALPARTFQLLWSKRKSKMSINAPDKSATFVVQMAQASQSQDKNDLEAV